MLSHLQHAMKSVTQPILILYVLDAVFIYYALCCYACNKNKHVHVRYIYQTNSLSKLAMLTMPKIKDHVSNMYDAFFILSVDVICM